jgi:hypothetical protein
MSGAPDFTPAPSLRADNWYDCPATLHVHLMAADKPVQLTVSSAAENSPAGASAVVHIGFAAPPLPPTTGNPVNPLRGVVAIFCAVLGLITGIIALGIALRAHGAMKAAEHSAQEILKDQRRESLRLDEIYKRINQIETTQQGLASGQAEIATQQQNLERIVGGLQEQVAAAQTPSFAAAPEATESANPPVPPAPPPTARRDPVGPAALYEAVHGWCARAQKEEAELPSQLLAKIDEMRQLAGGTVAPAPQSPWRDLAFSIVSLVADHTDQHLDPRRTDPEWQARLRHIFASAGVEEICSPRNAPVNEVEYYTVGTLPRQSPDDLPDHVARLRQRGFRMEGELVRKAAVVIYH